MPDIAPERYKLGKILLTSLLLASVAMPAIAAPKSGYMPMQLAPSAGATEPAMKEAPSKPHLGIAAQVGDEAISSYDVDNRIKFIIATAHLSNTPDVIEHIKPQIVRSLVDEKLELQEAEKNDIKVTQADVDQAIANIEQQREMPAGAIKNMLSGSNVPQETFTNQIRAQISWNRLLVKKIRPQVRVSDAEIAIAAKRFVASAPKQAASTTPQEFRIGVVAIPVDKPSRENEVHRLGEKLVNEVRSGANFEEVSRQFSSSTASNGGKIETFWVRLEQLDPHIARALVGASKGAITDPVRTSDGYTIVKVYETRDIGGAKPAVKEAAAPKTPMLKVKEYFIQSKEGKTGEEGAILSAAIELSKTPGSCDDGKVPAIKPLDDFAVHTHLYQDSVPEAAKPVVEPLALGGVSAPITSTDGVRIYLRCDPKSTSDKTAEHDQIYNMLIQQKMELEAQKYLRNLRRETFVEVR